MDDRAIGVFDSGLGGLTAVSALTAACPNENIVYFGDTGRMPYGGRSKEDLFRMAGQNAAFLMDFGVKIILVACGTVSSTVLPKVQETVPVPLFGVIGPAVREALDGTKNRRVGVIATQATIRSAVFQHALETGGCTVTAAACPRLVPLIEAGRTEADDPLVREAVEEYLCAIRETGADTLILGCTHYPLLEGAIRSYLGSGVRLVNASASAASALVCEMETMGLRTGRKDPGILRCYTSGDTRKFAGAASALLGRPLAGQVRPAPVFPV